MKYNYTVANNLNQSVQTDSSNEENDASENVQTIYSIPVRITLSYHSSKLLYSKIK